jgi:hypothetical protein
VGAEWLAISVTSEDYPMLRISKVPSMRLDFAEDIPSNIRYVPRKTAIPLEQ